ncbi:hypothetical protein Tco_1058024 [Tanacetum coccineum]|uniref:Uncharacterized protein n=1 Tax=Tanacetum coccineum TaxID=301880 RepID=A0ABQ5H8V8_9ASTR
MASFWQSSEHGLLAVGVATRIGCHITEIQQKSKGSKVKSSADVQAKKGKHKKNKPKKKPERLVLVAAAEDIQADSIDDSVATVSSVVSAGAAAVGKLAPFIGVGAGPVAAVAGPAAAIATTANAVKKLLA